MLAAELGEDETLAKRAGLLHDVGKAIDHEVEGSHVEIGVELAKNMVKMKQLLMQSILIMVMLNLHLLYLSLLLLQMHCLRLVQVQETLENYIRRLERLETLSESYDGVEKAFAIQAGREIRVIVSPEEIDDLKSYRLARDIKIRLKMNYNILVISR